MPTHITLVDPSDNGLPMMTREQFGAMWKHRLMGLTFRTLVDGYSDSLARELHEEIIPELLHNMYRSLTEADYQLPEGYLEMYDKMGRLGEMVIEMDRRYLIPASECLDDVRIKTMKQLHGEALIAKRAMRWPLRNSPPRPGSNKSTSGNEEHDSYFPPTSLLTRSRRINPAISARRYFPRTHPEAAYGTLEGPWTIPRCVCSPSSRAGSVGRPRSRRGRDTYCPASARRAGTWSRATDKITSCRSESER